MFNQRDFSAQCRTIFQRHMAKVFFIIRQGGEVNIAQVTKEHDQLNPEPTLRMKFRATMEALRTAKTMEEKLHAQYMF